MLGPCAPHWAPPFLAFLWFGWPERYPLTRIELAVAILRIRPWGTRQNDGEKQSFSDHSSKLHSGKSRIRYEAAKLEHVFCHYPCRSLFLTTWCQHAMNTLGWGEAHINIKLPTLVYHAQKYWATWPCVVLFYYTLLPHTLACLHVHA
jgi:hypothetical protein